MKRFKLSTEVLFSEDAIAALPAPPAAPAAPPPDKPPPPSGLAAKPL